MLAQPRERATVSLILHTDQMLHDTLQNCISKHTCIYIQ
jgi:ABC-type transport system involved in Fe-S cluster assembly fused permease/ATPase subunit